MAKITAKQILDFIGQQEAGGNYNAYYGNPYSIKPLGEMSVGEVMAFQKQLAPSGSTAIGKYQIKKTTLHSLVRDGVVKKTDKFTPEVQDKLATSLLERRGLKKVEDGKMSVTQFGNNLAKEWASLPVLTGPKAGQSYYAGDGLNSARTTTDHLTTVLQQAMQQPADENPPLPRERPNITGDTLAKFLSVPPPAADPVGPGLSDPISGTQGGFNQLQDQFVDPNTPRMPSSVVNVGGSATGFSAPYSSAPAPISGSMNRGLYTIGPNTVAAGVTQQAAPFPDTSLGYGLGYDTGVSPTGFGAPAPSLAQAAAAQTRLAPATSVANAVNPSPIRAGVNSTGSVIPTALTSRPVQTVPIDPYTGNPIAQSSSPGVPTLKASGTVNAGNSKYTGSLLLNGTSMAGGALQPQGRVVPAESMAPRMMSVGPTTPTQMTTPYGSQTYKYETRLVPEQVQVANPEYAQWLKTMSVTPAQAGLSFVGGATGMGLSASGNASAGQTSASALGQLRPTTPAPPKFITITKQVPTQTRVPLGAPSGGGGGGGGGSNGVFGTTAPAVTIASGKTVPVGTTGTSQGGAYSYQVQPDGSILNTTTGRITAPAAGVTPQPTAQQQNAATIEQHQKSGFYW